MIVVSQKLGKGCVGLLGRRPLAHSNPTIMNFRFGSGQGRPFFPTASASASAMDVPAGRHGRTFGIGKKTTSGHCFGFPHSARIRHMDQLHSCSVKPSPGRSQNLRQLACRKLNTHRELILNEYRTMLFVSTAVMPGYPQMHGIVSHGTASEVNFVV